MTMKFSGLAVAVALCVGASESVKAHNAAFVSSQAATSARSMIALQARSYGPSETVDEVTTLAHGIGCPCCLTPDFFINMSPREARIETPLKAVMATSVAASFSPSAARAAGKTFDTALNQYFPLSLPTSVMIQKVVTTLGRRNFNRSNTLFGSSVCPDEINSKPSKSLAAQFQSVLTDQNGVFTLGGLGGIPFVGISGMGAFLSHTPTNGKVVIMYGPHVGISDDGQVGKVERLGKEKLSGSCGAGLGAYKAIYAERKAELEAKAKAEAEAKAKAEAAAKAKAEAEAAAAEAAAKAPPPAPEQASITYTVGGRTITVPKMPVSSVPPAPTPPAPEPVKVVAPPAPTPTAPAPTPAPKKQSVMDNQEDYIIRKLSPRLTTPTALSVSAAAMPAFVTNQMYDLVKELLMEEMKSYWSADNAWDNINEIVLLGGIVINRGQIAGSIESREDYFQPLVFDTYTKPPGGGQPQATDLFLETFGAKADSWFD